MDNIKKFSKKEDIMDNSNFQYEFGGTVQTADGTIGAAFNISADTPLPSGFEHLQEVSVSKDDIDNLPANYDTASAKQAMECC